jgi:hypothetical protein
MQQLAGVDLQTFLQDISRLPAAMGDKLASPEKDGDSSTGQ